MNSVALLLPVAIFVSYVNATSYYITPVSSAEGIPLCVVDSSSFGPCFHLHQLNKTLLSNHKSLTLMFLQGSHKVSKNHSFILDARYLNISSVLPDTQDKVHIDCQQQGWFLFQNAEDVIISGVEFISCDLEMVQSSRIRLIKCRFAENTMNYTVRVANAHKVFVEHCLFDSNNGALFIEGYRISATVILNSTFSNNRKTFGKGGAIYAFGERLSLNDSRFIDNTAELGGAIYHHLKSSNQFSEFQVSNTVFKNNVATENGGAIFFFYTVNAIIYNCSFLMNSAGISGGALFLTGSIRNIDPTVTIEISNITSNHAGLNGGAMFCYSTIYGKHYITITDGIVELNSASNGGFAHILRCTIATERSFFISNNSATSNGGAIFAHDSLLDFSSLGSGKLFSHNRAGKNGGALYLYQTRIYGDSGTNNVTFSNNAVTSMAGKGGAIFILDRNCDILSFPEHRCFVEYFFLDKSDISLIFENNRASQGSVLYGGLLDRCLPPTGEFYPYPPNTTGMDIFKEISLFEPTPLALTSEPLTLCLCTNKSEPDCSLREVNITKPRGGTVSIELTALDQAGNQIMGLMRASYGDIAAQLDKGEGSQEISNKCTRLVYHIFTAGQTATLLLEVEGPCRQSRLSTIPIHFEITPCLAGFEQKNDRCACDRRLASYIDACSIEENSIQRKGPVWLRYDEKHLKLHANCPLDYCQVDDPAISIPLPDLQCANHRSGVLCGACQHGYSIALGSSKCLSCTAKYTYVGLIFAFAIAGVALVTFLLVCNITVSAGTLNGLVFYVNVVSISGLTSLHNCSIHPLLSVFIAWVNLDLGIETCFYPNMDTHQKTWLQFAFPLYIWLLVGAIIVASHYSSRAMRIFGRNNVAILATLFLLSYSKILKTIITAFTSKQLLVGKAHNVTDHLLPHSVWTYDGNVDFFSSKHVALFAVSLTILLVLFLPYTLMLTFGQYLRSMQVRKGLRWLTHSTAFISILDAYHAPYNKKHRYWTGLLLLVHCLLFATFATNSKDNTLLTDMFAVSLTVTGILTFKTFATKIYKSALINSLNLCFILNLGTLSATLYYLEGRNSANHVACRSITASISVAFAIFIVVVGYHTWLQLRKTRCYSYLQDFCSKQQNAKPHHPHEKDEDPMKGASTKKPVSTTTVELREALLESVHQGTK